MKIYSAKSLFNIFFLLFFLLPLYSGCGSRSPGENQLTIYSAASLSDVLAEISPLFKRETGVEAVFDLASSGMLAKRIAGGAPADIFLSADVKWTDFLINRGRLEKGSKREIARNRLVCVTPSGSDISISVPEGLAGLEKVSIGDPDHVPAGYYARQALESSGLWDTLASKDRLAFAWSVRAALSFVEEGEVEAGIVYLTDAMRSQKVRIAFSFPENAHDPVCYYAAAGKESKNKKAVKLFLEFLTSGKARVVLSRHGFMLSTTEYFYKTSGRRN